MIPAFHFKDYDHAGGFWSGVGNVYDGLDQLGKVGDPPKKDIGPATQTKENEDKITGREGWRDGIYNRDLKGEFDETSLKFTAGLLGALGASALTKALALKAPTAMAATLARPHTLSTIALNIIDAFSGTTPTTPGGHLKAIIDKMNENSK